MCCSASGVAADVFDLKDISSPRTVCAVDATKLRSPSIQITSTRVPVFCGFTRGTGSRQRERDLVGTGGPRDTTAFWCVRYLEICCAGAESVRVTTNPYYAKEFSVGLV